MSHSSATITDVSPDAHGHGANPEHAHNDPHHNPHLAHHFDTMEQQYDSGKLGMWVFLATELLMFGGLFCAYAVYRANHPDVFLYAHTYLDTTMGAINTVILLASSLTMAWAVRASQLNQNKALVGLLVATLFGGAGFMVIKAIEYNSKIEHHLAPGYFNEYSVDYKGSDGKNNADGVKQINEQLKAEALPDMKAVGIASNPATPFAFIDPNASGPDAVKLTPHYVVGTAVSEAQLYATAAEASRLGAANNPASSITPAPSEGQSHDASTGPPSRSGHSAVDLAGVPSQTGTHEAATSGGKTHSDTASQEGHAGMPFVDMSSTLSRQRVNTFFGIYYCMTGLHGVHVIVGMGLIYWILYRAANSAQRLWIVPLPVVFIGAYSLFIFGISQASAFMYIGIPVLAAGVVWTVARVVLGFGQPVVATGEFSSSYFMPVDLVGLYWHLVDLIWIFLFPLLYLIHGKV